MNRNKCSAPLSFIGDLSSTIFGMATQDDLRKVADKVNALICRGVDIGKTLVQHETDFESYMAKSNHRYDELREIVIDNHNAVMEAHKADMLWLDEVKADAQANTERHVVSGHARTPGIIGYPCDVPECICGVAGFL